MSFVCYCVGGISTSGTVTEVAGRGIGLDVVRETGKQAQSRSGNVDCRRARAARWRSPSRCRLLSLSAVMVESGGLSASLALDAVRQTLRLAETDVVHSPDGDSIVFDGKTIPFLPLARALGHTALTAAQAEQRFSAVVVRSGCGTCCSGRGSCSGHGDRAVAADPRFCRG